METLITRNYILFLFIQNMKREKQLFDETVSKQNLDDAFVQLYHFLCDLFAVRENLGITDTAASGNKKEHTVYGALKNIYECIKHRNYIKSVQEMNLFIYGYSYPFTYPRSYKRELIFTKMDEVVANKKNNNKELRNSMIYIHNNFLANRSISKIMETVIKECSDLPFQIGYIK